MSFDTEAGQLSTNPVGPGETWVNPGVFSTRNFDPAIKTGKWASTKSNGQLATGVTGTLSGVVTRDIASSLEVTLSDDLGSTTGTVRYMYWGLIACTVKTGDTPGYLAKVYVNAAGESTTSSSGNTATNAKFVRQVQPDVWMIYVNL